MNSQGDISTELNMNLHLLQNSRDNITNEQRSKNVNRGSILPILLK